MIDGRALQRALLVIDPQCLPRYGVDGDVGGETTHAVAEVLEAHGQQISDPKTVSEQEVAYVIQLASQVSASRPGLAMIDRRPYAGTNRDYGARSWAQVKGWCLHQTACYLSSSSDVARCDGIGAHYVVYPDGRIFQLHDLTRLIVHGNWWNTETIGIEIDGLFAGVEGDIKTVWDDPSTARREVAGSMTQAQIDAVKALIRHDRETILAHGGKPEVIVAHRQASVDRRDDPGSKVWREIAMPLHAELGLHDGGPGFKLGDGYPIPVEWDPSRTSWRY